MRSTSGWVGRRWLRRCAVVVACLVGAGLPALAGSGGAGAAGGLTATWTSGLNSGLQAYGDTSGRWTSGDNGIQVALPNGQALWLFNDSFYGPVNGDGTADPYNMHMVHNMELLTSGSGSTFTVNNTIAGAASGGVPTPAVGTYSGAGGWAWPGSAVVDGSNVDAIYNVIVKDPGSTALFPYSPLGNEVVSMPLSSLTDPATYTQPVQLGTGGHGGKQSSTCTSATAETNCIQWGVSMINSSGCPSGTFTNTGCTYIYGEVWPTPGSSLHTLVQAVAQQGQLSGTWYYDTTSGWSSSWSGTTATLAGPLSTAVQAWSAYQIGSGSYVALESTGTSGVVAFYSGSPDFTGAASAKLFNQPTSTAIPGYLGYQFHIEPAYSSGTNVVMGYSVNSVDHDAACLNWAPYVDIAAYQPEFDSFALPASVTAAQSTGTGTLPAPQFNSFSQSPVSGEVPSSGGCSTTVPAPTGVSATYGGVGGVSLSWTDPGGLYQYDIRREDETSVAPVWTQFAYPVWDSPCDNHANNCYTDDAHYAGLIPGHTYLYQLDTYDWSSGGHSSGWDGGAAVTLPAKITGVNSGLCASVAYASGANGAGLDQESCIQRYAPQEWAYSPTRPDPNANYEEYQIQNLNSDYCMQPVGTGLGAGIEQTTCTTAAIGQWEFRVTDANYDLQLYNPASGLCLGSSGNGQTAGTWLALVTCSTASTTTWDSSLAY